MAKNKKKRPYAGNGRSLFGVFVLFEFTTFYPAIIFSAPVRLVYYVLALNRFKRTRFARFTMFYPSIIFSEICASGLLCFTIQSIFSATGSSYLLCLTPPAPFWAMSETRRGLGGGGGGAFGRG